MMIVSPGILSTLIVVLFVVKFDATLGQCPAPINGALQCPNGAFAAFGDSCTFSCNPGYELQGPQNGVCLTDQTWSSGQPSCVLLSCPDTIIFPDGDVIYVRCRRTYLARCRFYCIEGYVGEDVIYLCNVTNNPAVLDWVPIGGVHSYCHPVECPAPINGVLQCSGGTTGTFRDNCTFSCNPGYEVQGPQTGMCLANQLWSEGLPSCVPLNCPARILVSDHSVVSLTNSACTLPYLSRCPLYCIDGYIGDIVYYLCNVTNDPAVVDWAPIGGVHHSCRRAECPVPANAVLHCPNGATGMFGDSCIFSCNPGYDLQGPQTGICLADQTWSRGLPSCVPLNCPARILLFNNSELSLINSTCALTYLSRCRVYCKEGFIGEDVIYLCNVTSDPIVVDWVPMDGIHHQLCQRDSNATDATDATSPTASTDATDATSPTASTGLPNATDATDAHQSEEKSDDLYIPITAGIGGVLIVLILVVLAVLLFKKKPCKNKAKHVDNLLTSSTKNTYEQVTSQVNPLYSGTQESDFVQSSRTPSLPFNVQHGLSSVNAPGMDQPPRYHTVMGNQNVPDESDIVEQKKLAEQKEIVDCYDIGEYITEEPMYEPISNFNTTEGPLFENGATMHQNFSLVNSKMKDTGNPYHY